MRRPALVALLAILVAVGAGACLKKRPAGPTPAPAFDLTDLGGGRMTLAGLKGKVVILDFWATWCGPCIAEIPEYKEFWHKNQSRGVDVVGVVFDSGPPQEIADFVREHQIPYRQLLGDDKLLAAYDANVGFPTTFVIDAQGLILTKIEGAIPKKFDRLQKTVDEALATKAAGAAAP